MESRDYTAYSASGGQGWSRVRTIISGKSLSTFRDVMADAALRESLLVTLLVVFASAGLALVFAFCWVIRYATIRRPDFTLDWLVVCGHALENGAPSAEFQTRLEQAEYLAVEQPGMMLVLTGGGKPSEAAVGRDWLLSRGRIDAGRIVLEEYSRNTFENLRQAGAHIPAKAVIGVLSSRSHLGRIRLFSRHLGLSVELAPAEKAWYPGSSNLLAGLREAAFVSWFVIGRWWARTSRRKHLLERIR